MILNTFLAEGFGIEWYKVDDMYIRTRVEP
jgi:hypothetical protein